MGKDVLTIENEALRLEIEVYRAREGRLKHMLAAAVDTLDEVEAEDEETVKEFVSACRRVLNDPLPHETPRDGAGR